MANDKLSLSDLNRLKTLQEKKVKDAKQILENEEDMLQVIIRGIEIAKKTGGRPEKKSLSIPKEYEATMKIEKKIIYILNLLKEASVKDIASKMCTIEKPLDEKIAYRRTQQAIVKMVSKELVIKMGDYNSLYKLNKV